MIPRDILRQVKRLEITTRHLVEDVFSGQYHSVFKGRGMEFVEVREYQPGDDYRTIDWNVTARSDRPFVKRFVEERELTVMLVVDLSRSGQFGSGRRTKNEVAAELCALLAFSAIRNKDKVGLLAFTDHVELFVPPAKSRQHVLRLIRDILAFEPAGRGTRVGLALDEMSRVLKRQAVVFLISDFIDEGYERALKIAARRHDLVVVRLRDPRESQLPAVGLVAVEDLEAGGVVVLDASDRRVRQRYADEAAARAQALTDLCRASATDVIDVSPGETAGDTVAPLAEFFRARARRVRHGR